MPIENVAMQDRNLVQWDKDDIDALNLIKVDVLVLNRTGRCDDHGVHDGANSHEKALLCKMGAYP